MSFKKKEEDKNNTEKQMTVSADEDKNREQSNQKESETSGIAEDKNSKMEEKKESDIETIKFIFPDDTDN